jgi:ABC-2 type transport system permease protein
MDGQDSLERAATTPRDGSARHAMGERRFGRVNWLGTYTLAERECRRFLNIWRQTLVAPAVTAGLFLTVFALAIGPSRPDVMGVPFLQFLAPGLVMMTVIQQSFANTSSSIVVSKVQGNIVDTLMPPLNGGELVTGYIAGGIARGLFVGLPLVAAMAVFLGTGVAHPLWLLAFLTLGGALLGGLGIVTGIFATKFDQTAAITNFLITPLSFLSGTFYSVDAVPGWMNVLLHVNPVFYLIDGMRYGALGASDSSPWLGLAICIAATGAVLVLCWHWFRIGYRLKP